MNEKHEKIVDAVLTDPDDKLTLTATGAARQMTWAQLPMRAINVQSLTLQKRGHQRIVSGTTCKQTGRHKNV